MMVYSAPKTTDITLTRSIPASPEEVYDAWLDPNTPGGPWSGPGRAILQAQVDGLFYLCVDHEGRQWAHYGRFTALERARRIEYTWVSDATRGLESLVTLTFEPRDDKTLVTLQHVGVPDDDFGRQHRDGWGGVLDTFLDRFANNPQNRP